MRKNLVKRLLAAALILCLMLGCLPAAAAAEVETVIGNLEVDHRKTPMGMDNPAPEFRWEMTSDVRGEKQTAYQIVVRHGTDVVWDTGKVESDQSNGIVYAGRPLESGVRYDWTVTVWNKDGIPLPEQSSWFEMGLLDQARDWAGAEFIAPAVKKDDEIVNYTIEFDFKIERSCASLIFGATDSSHFLMWQVNAWETSNPNHHGETVYFRPHIWNGSAKMLADLDISHIIAWEDRLDEHTMKIEVVGTTVYTYIDGEKLDWTYTSNQAKFGSLGFRHMGTTVGAEEAALFDNLVVTNTDTGKAVYSNDFSSHLNPFTAGTLKDGWMSQNCTNVHLGDVLGMARDYTIEFDFKIEAGNIGIIFGLTDSSHFLMWQLTEKLMFRPHIWNPNAACITEVDVSHIITAETVHDVHSMKIEVINNTVYTYVDGIKLDWTYIHAQAAYGMIGFRNSSSVERAFYDNFVVTDTTRDEVIYSNDFTSSIRPFSAGELRDGWIYQNGTGLVYANLEVEAVSAPMFRKEFTVKEGLVSARLYATSLGIYEAYINGEKVGDQKMAPGWTNYHDYIQYQAYDVTEMLTAGENAMGAIVGNGWYSGHVSTYGGVNKYGVDEAFISQLVLTYSDGSVETLGTDDTWQSYLYGPYEETCNQNGESYNAMKEVPGWVNAGFEGTGWIGTMAATLETIDTEVDTKTVALVAQPEEPARVIEELPVTFLAQTGTDTYVYDVGQNISGLVRITVDGKAGTTLRLRHGEMVYKDTNVLYTANLREAKATDYYVLKGTGRETYEPAFTFHGFRYVEVSGLGYQPDAEDITALVVHTELERTGWIETDNDLVNQLYSNIIWSQRGNYLSVPTDCPQRDERLGWTGDAQIFARTGSFNFDIDAFYTKYMRDVDNARDKETGAIYDIAPEEGHPVYEGNCGWGDVAVIGPWTMYTAYGDTAILEENWDMMAGWIGYYKNRAGQSLIVNWGRYGDWLSINESTPMNVVGTSFFAYSTSLMAKMAEILGKEDEAAYYADLFEQIRAAYNANFVNPQTGVITGNTQTAYVLALRFGLIADKEVEAMAAENLVKRIEANNWHLTTGTLGCEHLLPALTDAGYPELAYQLLLNTTYPSWLYPVVNGATTIWERWNSYIAETGTFGSVGMNSFNHYAMGSVGEWLYEYAAGIRYDYEHPGYKQFILEPNPSAQLGRIGARFHSVYGTIVSEWEVGADATTYHVAVPANTAATIYLPVTERDMVMEGDVPAVQAEGVTACAAEDGKVGFLLESGSYTFTVGENLDPTVQLSVSGAETVRRDETAVTYTVSAANMKDLATVLLKVELDETYLAEPMAEAAGDWYLIWQKYENGVLAVALGNNEGVDGDGDLMTVTAKPTGEVGEASVSIRQASLSVFVGEDGEDYVEAKLGEPFVTTVLHNRFDVNKDGVVDQLDMTRAQRYYGSDFADADVDESGEVDLTDLVLILNQFHDVFHEA